MASILCDVHFWTTREDIVPKDTDQSTLKYYDKSQHKSMLERPYGQDKITFVQGRGQVTLLESKRLKASLKELEELMTEYPVIFSSWRSSSLFQLMLISGLIVNIHLNKLGDISKISFDKYLVGKLLEYITDVAFTSKVIIVTYLESRVTCINFTKPLDFTEDSIGQNEPKIQMLDLLGPPGRRLNRKILLSQDSNSVLFWWSISGQEVYPWAPKLNDEDRANFILYQLKNKKSNEPKRLGFARNNSDPVQVRFISDRTVLLVGQDASRHGEVQVDSALLTYYDNEKQLRRSRANRLSLGSSIKCSICVNDYLIIVSTADGNLMLLDVSQNKIECQTKANFVPTLLSLHPDQALVFAANEKGLIQCWDIALTPIYLQMADEYNTGYILDIGHNINRLPIGLCDMKWCDRNRFQPSFMESMAFNYFLLRFMAGPLALIRFSGGVLDGSGCLGPIQIVNQHLQHNNFNAVLLLLNQMDWPSQGETILIGMNKLFHKFIRQPGELTRENESWMEMCLGLFYAPNRPIPDDVIDEFSEQVHDITRKFFHRLLRHGQVTKAFKLAVDINDYDLFMDIHHYASRYSMPDLANAALIKAQTVFGQNDSNNEYSKSESSEEEEDESNSNEHELRVSSLPRPQRSLPSPMQLFSSTIAASATPAIAVLDQPLTSLESSMTTAEMQPQISATFLKTTSAKKIATNDYQTKAEIGIASPKISPGSMATTNYPESLSNIVAENPEDIKVIHFGVV